MSLANLADVVCRRGAAGRGFDLHVPSFRVEPGDLTAVTGPSGSGKSTFLDVLGLALAPVSGRFSFDGQDIPAAWEKQNDALLTRLRRSQIGYVLQQQSLLPALTAKENIALVRRLNGLPPWAGWLDETAARLGLARKLGQSPASLSIGERQRAALLRALANEAPLLLADEPTAALDQDLGEEVFDLLAGLAHDLGRAVVVASHDQRLIARHPFRRYQVAAGELKEAA